MDSTIKTAFLDELEKIAYGEKEHAGLMSRTLGGLGAGEGSSFGKMMHRTTQAADKGVRHPHIPANADIHAMPGAPKRDVAKRIVGARQKAIKDLAGSMHSGSNWRQVKAMRDLGTTQHQWADLSAHYEKPLEAGTASPRARAQLGKVPGGRTAASGIEHAKAGLKAKLNLTAPIGSNLDEMHPDKFKTDLVAQKRAKNWGITIKKNLSKELLARGMSQPEADAAIAKLMAKKMGKAPRVAGRLASNLGHLRRAIFRR